jgi:transposase-like protein
MTEAFARHPDYEIEDLDEADLAAEPMPPARELKRIGAVMDRAIASRAFIVGAMGPVGSGKTIGFSIKFQHHAAKQKGRINSQGQLIRKSRYVFIRDTYPNLDRNTIPSWNKVVPRHVGRFVASSPRVHQFSMTLKRDGHLLDSAAKAIDIAQVEIEFRAIGDQTVEDALRGLECTAALVNEADRTHPDILTFLAGRVGRYNDLDPDLVVDPQIVLDLNGCDDENWTHKILVEQQLPDDVLRAVREVSGDRPLIEYFEQPPAILEGDEVPGGWMVNPNAENLENLTRGYYERQYAFAKMKGNQTYIDRMLRSKFTPPRSGRTVFPEYIEDQHSGTFDAVPGFPLLIFADQGLIGAVLVCQLVKGQLRVLEEVACVFETEDDEIEVVQMGGETLGQQVRDLLVAKYAGFTIGDAVCDPAGAAGEGAVNFKSWRQEFQKGLGHRVRKARVPRNAIAPRLEAVRNRLNRTLGPVRALIVHKRCTMTRRAFRTKYYYQRIGKGSGDGYYSAEPKKVQGYADLMDALQYGCFEIEKGLKLSPHGQGLIGHNGGPALTNDAEFDVFSGG